MRSTTPRKSPSPYTRITVFVLLILFLVLLPAGTIAHLLTEAWWFEAVNYSEVFWKILKARSLVWLGTFLVYSIFLWFNYALAMRITQNSGFRLLEGTEFELYAKNFPNFIAAFFIFILAFTAAGASIDGWETILKFIHATDFNTTDPIYERDIGFYVFQLPFYQGIQNWLLMLFLSGFLVSAPIYLLKGSIDPEIGNWKYIISGKPKTHLSILLAAIAILFAVGFWLGRYDLLYTSGGVVYGAGYTDTHAITHYLWLMMFLAIAEAILLLVSLRQKSIALPGYGLVIYLLALVFIRGIYPSFQQQFIVEPNELSKEKPYLQYNIAYTRQAYDLDSIQTKQYPANPTLTREDLDEHQATLRNIRLWDYRPLLSTYRQLQEIRLYYKFSDLDIDRYTLNGNYRQVMLAPRELDYDRVPTRARTWVNKHLKYTHGYGLVMSPVNKVTPEGLPELFIKNIPPESTVNLQVSQPRIYYGEETDNYIFTNTSTPEFDYPLGDENASNFYEGIGGVPMNTLWRRLVYAYDLGNLKVLISNYFTPESHIHYYRNIEERITKIAPFLRFDSDPYITLIDGKLKWLIDAYTVSDRYPYSEPVSEIENAQIILETDNENQLQSGDFNYVRNSVKVVVDAYDGTIEFLAIDDEDPVLATYKKIFPQLFHSPETISDELIDHFRYPLNLYQIQAQMYLSYHMTDPEVFYNQEDLWRFPEAVFQEEERLIEPYYLIMRLPEAGAGEEFVLIMPFTPVNKDNMVAWMAARSDGENYGTALLYEFPKQELIYGPGQIEARINQNPQISEQLTLWSQEGSNVIRGDLLVIPIEESILYVQPIYLRATEGELPELKRVIVAYNQDIVMETSLDRALAAIFGNEQAQREELPTDIRAIPTPGNLTEAALQTFRQAQEAAQAGNWTEYGRLSDKLETILEQLNREVESTPSLSQ
ncbi:UPF0182 family membrane protein [Oscillatoria salina]|uniref:UPF0182 family membrane protein n=1 Tax=Oscillatoria salina TaxID=331517 RepID=UPI001CCE0535|nr:UPF0182 family protein [Oscillatoria salina]